MEAINTAIEEARKIQELSVQEEVVTELEKVTQAMEHASKEIERILRL